MGCRLWELESRPHIGMTERQAPVVGFIRCWSPRLDPSRGKDMVLMPIEILARGGLGARWQEQCLLQRRPPVVLPGEWVFLNRIGQSAGTVDPQPAIDGEQAGIEGHVMGGASGQAVSEVQALGEGAVLPGLDVACKEHPCGAEHGGLESAEHAPATA